MPRFWVSEVLTALSRLSRRARGLFASASVSAVTGGVVRGTAAGAGVLAAAAAGAGEGAGVCVVFVPRLVCALSGSPATAQVSNINRRTAVMQILLRHALLRRALVRSFVLGRGQLKCGVHCTDKTSLPCHRLVRPRKSSAERACQSGLRLDIVNRKEPPHGPNPHQRRDLRFARSGASASDRDTLGEHQPERSPAA